MSKGSARRPKRISAKEEERRYRETFNAPSNFHEFCGPAVVASRLGISRREAARRLLEQRNRRLVKPEDREDYMDHGYTGDDELLRLMKLAKVCSRNARWVYPKRMMTFAVWLRERRSTRDALVIVAQHVIHVRGNTVIEDDGLPCLKDYVVKVLTV